jgi:DNA-binding MarR family transcriptional regulator
MASQPPPASPLFLREAEIRRGIELLLFGHRELLESGDAVLAREALGRAHHRALYFIAQKPDLSVGELLDFLGVTKQSLSRVIRELEDRGLMSRSKGQRDRRQILLHLTPAGLALEQELFANFREKMMQAYSNAGPGAVAGFWTVLESLLTADAKARANELTKKSD